MTAAPTKPRIAIGSDHAGFSVKEVIRKYLESAGYAVSDLGTSSEESVDYPDYGKAVGEHVVSKQADLGIAVCGSGIGISIAANKVPAFAPRSRMTLTPRVLHASTMTPTSSLSAAASSPAKPPSKWSKSS